jgi:hypothetical protein
MTSSAPTKRRSQQDPLSAIAPLAPVLALVAIVVSTNYWVFLAANACLGVTTASAQLLIPFAASLASEKTRGRVVGTVTSGLLTGIERTRFGATWRSRVRAAIGVSPGLAQPIPSRRLQLDIKRVCDLCQLAGEPGKL